MSARRKKVDTKRARQRRVLERVWQKSESAKPPTPKDVDAALMRLWQADADEMDGGRKEKVKRDHGRSYKSTLAVIARVASATWLLHEALKNCDRAGMERALDRLGKLDPKHSALGIVDILDDADDVRRAMDEYLEES